MKDKWIALIAASLLFIAGIGLGFLDKSIPMGLALSAGSVVMAFANLDKILRFKGGQIIEVEMRELHNMVNESHATIEQLKKITHPLIAMALQNLTWGDRFGSGLKESDKRQIIQRLNEACEILSLHDPELERIQIEFNSLVGWDRFGVLLHKIQQIPNIDENIIKKLHELKQSDTLELPRKNEIDTVLQPIKNGSSTIAMENMSCSFTRVDNRVNSKL